MAVFFLFLRISLQVVKTIPLGSKNQITFQARTATVQMETESCPAGDSYTAQSSSSGIQTAKDAELSEVYTWDDLLCT